MFEILEIVYNINCALKALKADRKYILKNVLDTHNIIHILSSCLFERGYDPITPTKGE